MTFIGKPQVPISSGILCLEDAPSGRAVVYLRFSADDGPFCPDREDPGTCCPGGFEWIGIMNGSVVCLEVLDDGA